MSEIITPPIKPPSRFLQGLTRGFRRRCPNCGAGPLYRGYLTVEKTCPLCGHDNGQYRADDAGPYFTILVVGHIYVGPVLLMPFVWKAPIWLVIGLTLPALAALTLILLPLIKGAVIGAQWSMRGSGGPEPEDELVQESWVSPGAGR
jgi:uncharacterized protein (DUF983 family)